MSAIAVPACHRAGQGRRVLLTLLLSTATLAHAAQGRLTLVVQSPIHAPIANVRIGIAGAGSIGTTDVGGRTELQLAAETSVGSHVRLQVVPPPSMFMVSPFDGDAIVPRFENESGNFLAVILMPRRNLEALENGVVLSGLIRQSQRQANAASKAGGPSTSKKPFFIPAAYETGKKAPSAEAPGGTPLLGPADRLPLVTDDVVRTLAVRPQDVASALKAWKIDPLDWKLVMTTALFEFGDVDPFSTVSVDPSGIAVGLRQWHGGDALRALWRDFRQADTRRFDEIMGPDAKAVAAWLAADAAMPESLSRLGAADETRHVTEPWRSRLEQLGGWIAYQRIQVDAVRPDLVAADKLARATRLRSERARAYFYDLVINAGQRAAEVASGDLAADAAAFESQVHRAPDEQERLMMMSNRWLRKIAQGPLRRFEAALRQRRYLFALGEGQFGERIVSLDDVGIRLRDVDTGAAIPLSGDGAMLDKLRGGWLPEQALAAASL
jgi:hypothetical protein